MADLRCIACAGLRLLGHIIVRPRPDDFIPPSKSIPWCSISCPRCVPSWEISQAAKHLPLPCIAFAQGWQGQNVTDHLRGKVGLGQRLSGLMEDERGRTHPGYLVANCSDNSTTMYVGSDRVFVGGNSSRVAWTVDNGPVQHGTWNICADNRCAGLWHGNGIPFLKSLFGKNLLKITIRRYDGQALNGTFTISGAKEALEPVGQLCGWIPKVR